MTPSEGLEDLSKLLRPGQILTGSQTTFVL